MTQPIHEHFMKLALEAGRRGVESGQTPFGACIVRGGAAVVMVFGATGSAGDGVLKAAIQDPEVEKVYVITRRASPRIDAGVAAGRVEMRIHPDFGDYASLADILGEVDTVLWALV